MDSIPLADAKTPLSALTDRVDAGDPIGITRRGKPFARLTAVEKPRLRTDLGMPEKLTAGMKRQEIAAADLVRSMRDEDRY